ncbi:hypothetical protein N7519_003641 [Penicillium mononematosum]|uniref:uncharacterized protein n=1 Tax=Penicillium mononematosum TaxID=268346 RepID=UPI0025498E5F|nr:uncharacterized protein N7519_003641 [Penicillium mononematosum]KAJ6188733.1 hypothetical protein N7519_003641 [Penicillium mononematosum]
MLLERPWGQFIRHLHWGFQAQNIPDLVGLQDANGATEVELVGELKHPGPMTMSSQQPSPVKATFGARSHSRNVIYRSCIVNVASLRFQTRNMVGSD